MPDETVTVGERVDRETLGPGRETGQVVGQAGTLPSQAHEDEMAPDIDVDRHQTGLGRAEIGIVAEVAGRLQFTVPTEGPAVVPTHEVADRSSPGPGDGSGSMGADIVESAQHTVGRTNDEDGPTGEGIAHEGSGCRQFGRRTEHRPLVGPDRASFAFVGLGGDVPLGVESGGHESRVYEDAPVGPGLVDHRVCPVAS